MRYRYFVLLVAFLLASCSLFGADGSMSLSIEVEDAGGEDTRTEIVELKYLTAAEAENFVAEKLSGHGTVQAIDDLKILLITDKPPKAKDLVRLLKAIDRPGVQGMVARMTEIVEIENGPASDYINAIQTRLSVGGTVVAEDSRGILILSDYLEKIKQVKDLLKTLDRPRPQVLIRARLYEIDETGLLDVGLDWGNLLDILWGTYTTGAFGAEHNAAMGELEFDPISSGINWDEIAGGAVLGKVSNVLGLLHRSGVAEVTAEPAIIVASGESGLISLGTFFSTQVPLKEYLNVSRSDEWSSYTTFYDTAANFYNNIASEVSPRSSTSRTGGGFVTSSINAGIDLEVVPTVGSGDLVMLDLSTTVDEFVGYGPGGYPITSGQTSITRATVKVGKPMVVAALTTERVTNTSKKFPVLGWILPGLFSRTENHTHKVHCVCVITVDKVNPENQSVIMDEETPKIEKSGDATLPLPGMQGK